MHRAIAVAILAVAVACGGTTAPNLHVHVNTPGGSINSEGNCTLSAVASVVDDSGQPASSQSHYTFRWYNGPKPEGSPFFIGRQTAIPIPSGTAKTVTVTAQAGSGPLMKETKTSLICSETNG